MDPAAARSGIGLPPSSSLAPFLVALLVAGLSALGSSPPRQEIPCQRPLHPAHARIWELASLPGSSPRLARRLLAFRASIDPLLKPDPLRWVSGLGTRRLHVWSRWLELFP